jgi:hypothetical protein
MVNRNGLRSPCAMIRRAFASPVVVGLSGSACPVSGLAAGIQRAPVLAPIREVEARAVTARDVEGSVGAEGERAHRVTRVLLAPIVDQDLLRAGHGVSVCGQARETAADDAPVARRARWVRTGVAPGRGRPSDGRVERVEDVDVRSARRELRVQRKPEQPAVPEVVHLGRQVREQRRRGVAETVEDLDPAALLSDEDAPVRGELDRRWVGQSRDRHGLLEAGRQGDARSPAE